MAGYRVFIVPESLVWHKVSASTKQSSFSQYYYYTRNGCFFLWRYDRWLLPSFMIYNILFGLRSLFAGNWQPLRGLVCGCKDFMRGRMGAFPSE